MSDFAGLYDVRDFVPGDLNLILSTFIKGLYNGDSWFSKTPYPVFKKAYTQVILALLASPNVQVKVACLKEDPNAIMGYSILSADYQVIHWVYVKSLWRGRGVAKAITPAHPHTVTHLTALGLTLMPKIPTAIFNPFYKI